MPKGAMREYRPPIKSRTVSSSASRAGSRHRGAMELGRNADGVLYFRQPMQGLGFVTWHVDLNGERYLVQRSLDIGDVLSQDAYALMHARGWIYTNKGGP